MTDTILLNLVRDYMYTHAKGYRNIVTRKSILDGVGVICDRSLREILAEIPEVISTSNDTVVLPDGEIVQLQSAGYYVLPLRDDDGRETRIARAIVNGEDRRRMIHLYLRQRQRRQAIRMMEESECQVMMAGV